MKNQIIKIILILLHFIPGIGLIYSLLNFDIKYLRNPWFIFYHIIGIIGLSSLLTILYLNAYA